MGKDLYRVPNEEVYHGVTINSAVMRPDTIEEMGTLETTEKDVILAAYPRSGRTWTSEIVFCLLNGGDLEAAKRSNVAQRMFFLDVHPPSDKRGPVKRAMKRFGEPRVLKVHMQAKHIQKQIDDNKAKLILVMRNPKDCLVSYYYYYRLNNVFGNFQGSFDEFFELFKAKRIAYGDWLDFYKGYWSLRNKRKVLVVTYEDLAENLRITVIKIATFLETPASDDTIDKICDHVMFHNMRSNKSFDMSNVTQPDGDNSFIRQGQVGTWTKVMSKEQSDYVDDVYAAEIARLGFPIRYHLKAKL